MEEKNVLSLSTCHNGNKMFSVCGKPEIVYFNNFQGLEVFYFYEMR